MIVTVGAAEAFLGFVARNGVAIDATASRAIKKKLETLCIFIERSIKHELL